MEQLTPQEWAREQVRRAPSFAVATAIMVMTLIISMFITFSSARPRLALPPVQSEIREEEPVVLEKIPEQVLPDEPDIKPPEDAPLVFDEDVSPVDAPIEDVTVDIDLTEDLSSDVVEPTDPIPMELTKKLATIGTSPGSGGFRGRLGNRTAGGRRRAARRYGMPRGTDKDILAALRWLKKVQEDDGSWNGKRWGGSAAGPAASTGLALLAFLGYGCTDREPAEFANTVKKAVNYLIAKQQTKGAKKGWFGERMYGQGICTMALAEAYGMMRKRDIKEAAQAGLGYILRAQPSDGGFGYTGAGNDTSVTGFQIQAIKSAMACDLNVPKAARDKVEAFLQRCINADGSTSYNAARSPGAGGTGTPSMTAASLTGRLFMGHKRTDADVQAQAKWLATKNYVAIGKKADNLYTVYYLSLSMFNMGGAYWKNWNEAFNIALRAKQEKKGPNAGSWPPGGFRYGSHGGRIYSTTMACLALEVYWRYTLETR